MTRSKMYSKSLSFSIVCIAYGIFLFSYSRDPYTVKFDDISAQIFRPYSTTARSLGYLLLAAGFSFPLISILKGKIRQSFVLSNFVFCALFALRSLWPIIFHGQNLSSLIDPLVWGLLFIFSIFIHNKISSNGPFILHQLIETFVLVFRSFVVILCLVHFLLPSITVSSSGRFVGFFAHPNFASSALIVISSVLILDLYRFSRQRRKSLYSCFIPLSFAFLSTYFLFLTGSRTGVLALTLSLILLSFTSQGSRKFALLFLLLFFVFSDQLITYVSGFDLRVLQLTDTRSEVWSQLLASAMNNPFTGTANPGASENSLLYLFANMGFMGILVYLLPLLILVRQFMQLRRNSTDLSLIYQLAFPLPAIYLTSQFEGILAKDLMSLPVLYLALAFFAIQSYLHFSNKGYFFVDSNLRRKWDAPLCEV